MTDLGFERPLYILPFDHRGSFQSGLFSWKGALSAEQEAASAEIARRYTRWCDVFAPRAEGR